MVGAGIVGLATARRIQQERPGASVTVWDKEDRVGAHQTSHNSGVVHAGLYYAEGSDKAALCRRGGALLREYCTDHGIAVTELGKLVVATSGDEVGALGRVLERARANGVPDVRWLHAEEIPSVEPFAGGVAAVHSPHTAVVDFAAVATALGDDVVAAGGTIHLGAAVTSVTGHDDAATVTIGRGRPIAVDRVVVCAGLGTDAVAPARRGRIRIVAFRGEYHQLSPEVADRVHGLIYPVPDPVLPFLGVHLTRTHAGTVLAGPNAVPATALEGYRRRDVDPATLLRLLAWPGARRLARRQWRAGVHEIRSSVSKAAFAAAVRRYLPSLRTHDLLPAPSGVRAQAVTRAGDLVDDFVIEAGGPVVVVRNAPSPAATSSLAIAETIVGRLLDSSSGAASGR